MEFLEPRIIGPRGTIDVRSFSIAELCFLVPPRDCNAARVRDGQILAMVQMAPLAILASSLSAVLTVLSLWQEQPKLVLLTWAGIIILLGGSRLLRILRVRRDPQFAALGPPSLRTILSPIVAMSLISSVPMLFWFESAPRNDQMVLLLLLFATGSGSSVTFSTVPPAALCFLYVTCLSGVIGMSGLHPFIVGTLMLSFAIMLTHAVFWNARQFAGHLAARIELEEKSELITLLREFDASGSEWLWELDADQCISHLSNDMGHTIGEPVTELIGRPLLDALDPRQDVAAVSTGMRQIVEALETDQPFRDVAIPASNRTAWWSLSGKPTLDTAGKVVGWRGVGSDITTARLTGSDSTTTARHDLLTGLGNRLLIRELLEEALLQQRQDRGGCALMLVDLDRFKLVNDTLGHEVGDQLLCEVARRLQATPRFGSVGRLGGDEFALVLSTDVSRADLSARAEDIIAALSAPYRIGVAELNIGATIGIAVAPSDGTSQDELTRSADLAMYSAKHAGRGSFKFFEPYMAEQAAANRALESDLRSALQRAELSLAYQPIVEAHSHRVIAREALLRWNHPLRGEVPPDVFVPVIEDAGLIGQVGNWVLREACMEAAGWDDGSRVAVNVSSAQLAAGPALVRHVLLALASSGLPADRLELELTESIFLADDTTTRATLRQLRAIGARLVLDDFGMGYSSYTCLTNGEFTKLKIDRNFTQPAADGGTAERAIVESILALARGLDLEVTAEGIETEAQSEAMTRLGCGQLQGFLFGRPKVPPPLHSPSRTKLSELHVLPGRASRAA